MAHSRLVLLESLQRRCLALCGSDASYIREFATKSVASKGGGESSRKSRTQDVIEALTPAERVVRTEEELAEAAMRSKEYSRQKMREHRAWQAAFMAKVKLRDEAIQALPESLREAALKPDLTLFPANRQIWVESPPLDQSELKKIEKDDGTKKKRKIGTKNT
jgi:hypothetical protein